MYQVKFSLIEISYLYVVQGPQVQLSQVELALSQTQVVALAPPPPPPLLPPQALRASAESMVIKISIAFLFMMLSPFWLSDRTDCHANTGMLTPGLHLVNFFN